VIAEELRSVFSTDREGPMAGMVRFIPNSQLNAVLIMSPQPEYLSRAETWVRRFDARAEGSEKKYFTYLVQNRRAQELVDVVHTMLANEARGRGAAPRNVAPQYREASIQSGTPVQATFQSLGARGMGSSGGGSAPSANGQGNIGSPQDPASQDAPTSNVGSGSPAPASGGEQAQEPRIKIGLDEGKNAILIHATPSDYRRVMRFIGSLDVMPKQVMIEATIAEVTLTDELKFGVRWYMQKKNATGTFTNVRPEPSVRCFLASHTPSP
jgi:general secretion pathway protein D